MKWKFGQIAYLLFFRYSLISNILELVDTDNKLTYFTFCIEICFEINSLND